MRRVTVNIWLHRLLTLALFLAWLVVVLRFAPKFGTQPASWLAFIGLLISPGYFLGELITWRLKLDWIERLAVAMPVGVAILAVPGIITFARHGTLDELRLWWVAAGGIVMVAWMVQRVYVRSLFHRFDTSRYPARTPWAFDEILLFVLLAAAFVLVLPTLSLDKIDGDAYAVATFSADALAGMPLNQVEPIFGTDLGPGVRMVFNQFLAMSYLWSDLSGIDPITLTAVASRSMLALWALFAAYTLGKAAGQSRRFGLFVASIQMLIYLAAPFVRGDNVSLFYFERTNADKFMVPITMLPVVFAFAIHYVRSGRRATWVAAAVATFAVSTIHPLIAAMLALAVTAFGAFHLLMNLRVRTSWLRVGALAGLVAVVMLLPAVQLILSRGEAPLASSYPSTFEGWSLGTKKIPILPFLEIETIDLYGPQPEISQLEATDAESTTDPFLIWRFAVNMERRRIILFDLQHYISDPSIVLEPPYLMALLLLPLVIWRRRRDVAAQFAVSVSLAVLLVMYNPILTPIIGALVMPWILWRFVWLLPYSLVIALAVKRIAVEWGPAILRWLSGQRLFTGGPEGVARYAMATTIVAASVLLTGNISQNLRNLNDRAASPYYYPSPQKILDELNRATATGENVTVLADADLSVTIPAYVAGANIVAHRAPTTSEVFPADRQTEALQRLIDQAEFFGSPYLTENSVNILNRYDARYVIVPSGSSLDMQLQLAPDWFTWLLDDQSYSLYAVNAEPPVTDTFRGNSAMGDRKWGEAESYFRKALAANPADLLALAGMAEISHVRGQFNEALESLELARAEVDLPILQYQAGLILVESGQLEAGLAMLDEAQSAAPQIPRYHIAYGDACMAAGQLECAHEQYSAAVANQTAPNDSFRLVALGNLWRQQGRTDQALPYYQQAVSLLPTEFNLFVLESAYREVGMFAESEALLADLQRRFPLSAEVVATQAAVKAAQDDIPSAVALYRRAIFMQRLFAQESADTYLALAQLLLSANRLDDARTELDTALALQPYNAAAHRLQGDLYRRQEQHEQALRAFERAYQLDPTQIDTYVALSNQLQLHGGQPEGIIDLLRETIEANPDEAILFLSLGDLLQTAGDDAMAIEAYQDALDRLDLYAQLVSQRPVRSTSESRAFIYSRLARAYENLLDTDTALNYYRAAVAAAPETPWTHVLLGDALRRSKDLAAAQGEYLLAIQSDPGYLDAFVGLAELYIDDGLYDEADELLRTAITVDDDNSDPYMRLAELEQRRGNYDQALVWLHEAADIAIDSRTINTPLIDSLMRYGDYKTASEYVQALLQVRPTDEDLVFRLGQVQLEMGDYAEAETTMLKARRLFPTNVRVYNELASLYMATGSPLSAIAMYQQALDLMPAEGAFYINLSQLLQQQGRYDEALTVLKSGLNQAADPADIYTSLSTFYAQQGELGLAESTLQEGIDELGETTSLVLALGRHYLASGDFALAQQLFERIVAQEEIQGQTAGLMALGDLYLRRGETESAVEMYERAIEREPTNPSYLVSLADAYVENSQPLSAEAAYRQALTLLPTFDNAYLHLGAYYVARERPVDARATYERGLRLAPTSSRLYTEFAAFLVELGDTADALTVLDQAVQMTPSSAMLIARANLLNDLGRRDDALRDLEQAKILQPGSIDVLIALGDLHRDAEEYVEAEQYYSSVVSLVPHLPIGYLRLGDLASRQGDLDSAQRWAEAASAVEPALQTGQDDVAQ